MERVLTALFSLLIALALKTTLNSREVSGPFNQSAQKGVTSPSF